MKILTAKRYNLNKNLEIFLVRWYAFSYFDGSVNSNFFRRSKVFWSSFGGVSGKFL